MFGAIGLIGGAVSALAGGGGAGGALGALAGGGGGGAFEAALTAAKSALGGGQDSQMEKMIDTGVQVMGGMMMRLAGEVLNSGMEDDGD